MSSNGATPKCPCATFAATGQCYHVGGPVMEPPRDHLLPAVRRMYARVMHPTEIQAREAEGLPVLPSNRPSAP